MGFLPPGNPDMCGKDFRLSLTKPSPNYRRKMPKYRLVPAFTIQAMQKNTRVIPPPKCNVYDPMPPKPSMFMSCYTRGEFPVSIEFSSGGKRLNWKIMLFLDLNNSLIAFTETWWLNSNILNSEFVDKRYVIHRKDRTSSTSSKKDGGGVMVDIQFNPSSIQLKWQSNAEDLWVPIEKLDFHHYLPMFFDGLAEGKYPFSFIVEQGINDMITKGAYKILPTIPQLIIPIKKAFETKRPSVLCHALKCVQMIVTGCDKVGEALVPYYRQILPILNLFKNRDNTTGSEIIDQMASGGENLVNMIEDTLQILEEYGGPDAYINLKYMIPTYESSTRN